MQKAKDSALLALLCALCAVCVFACLRAHQFGQDEAQLVADAHQTALNVSDDADAVSAQAVVTIKALDAPIDKATNLIGDASGVVRSSRVTLAKFDDTLNEINRDCDEVRTQKPCGTLADFAKLLKTVRGAAGQIEVAATHENKNLTTLDAQEVELVDDTHADLVGLSKLLGDADAVVTDPATKQAQQNLAAISANVAGISHDGKVIADRFTAPQPWWKKTLGAGETGLKIALCAANKVTCTL